MQYFIHSMNSVFYASLNLQNKLELASILHNETKIVFDGEPIILPLPDDAPSEIPRIILTSKDNEHKCHISKERVEFIYSNEANPDREVSELREQFLVTLGDIAKVVKSSWKAEVYRLGFVINSVSHYEAPVEIIKTKFIREGVLNHPRRLEVFVLDRMTWDNLKINRGYRVSTLIKREGKEERKLLSVNFDINTIPEEKYSFDTESIVAFYDKAILNIGESLRSLF